VNFFAQLWTQKPLRAIIIIALLLRIIAVIFSKGYAVHEDHFMVIETAQAWLDGTAYRDWLPGGEVNPQAVPKGKSITYVGMHYLLFQFLEFLGVMNAGSKMLIVRLIHALFSLLVVNYAYRITHLVSEKDIARYVGLLVATFWLLPFVSVHNFAEFFAVPFLMLATWFFLRPQYRDKPYKWAFLGGLVLGVAMSIWLFVFLFVIGFFGVLLYQKRWKVAFITFIGFALSMGLLQGVVDYFFWDRPFAELYTFFQQIEIPFTKPRRTIFSMYAVMLLLVLIPPISIFWLVGWVKSAKRNLLLFVPAFLVFLFFSFSIQQHERHIMVVFPFILISSVVGWNRIIQKSVFWNNHPGMHRSMVIFFWIVNFTLLFSASTMYSKRSPVEAMLYLQKHKNTINTVLIEDSNRTSVKSMPLFYMEKWVEMYKLPDYKEYGAPLSVRKRSNWEYIISTPRYFLDSVAHTPDFVLFVGQKSLDERIQRLKPYLPSLQYKKTIKAGIIDRIFFKINPKHNANQDIFIYRVAHP
jgi:hypothetical protein